MKKKTMISKVVCMMLAAMVILAFSAYGSTQGEDADGDSLTGNKENDPQTPEITYSFEGAYASSASDFRLEWVLNLYDDGTLVLEPGLIIIDTEEHEEKATGTWSESEGILTLSMENEDGTFMREYELEKDENGGYLLEMEVSLSTFVRPIEMRCVTEGFIPAGEAVDSTFN